MNEELVKKIISQIEALTARGSVSESDLDRVLDDNFKTLLRETMKK